MSIRRGVLFILLLSFTILTQAQTNASAIVFYTTDEGVQAGQVFLPEGTRAVDFNPIDETSRARVDALGGLLFAPIGGGEGVYTFAPYFEGFSTNSLEENKVRVDEVAWSPDGWQLAFRINSDAPEGNDGIWFWQPARELPTDPSYHILRDCPPGCGLVTPQNAERWESLDMTWSADSASLLVSLNLLDEERRGITVVNAVRDVNTIQSRRGPLVLRYDYGSWATNGGRIIVSGNDPVNQAVFGSIAPDGNECLNYPASEIGMAWVQHAVHHPTTGQILMLGSPISANSPLQLIDGTGAILSEPVGITAPTSVQWSPDREAVYVHAGDSHYIVELDGSIYDVTTRINDNSMVHWVETAPADILPIDLGEPIESSFVTEPVPSVTEEVNVDLEIGRLLQVTVDSVNLYAEPVADADIVTTLSRGEALIITDRIVVNGDVLWWRIQTLDFVGWVQGFQNGVPVLGE